MQKIQALWKGAQQFFTVQKNNFNLFPLVLIFISSILYFLIAAVKYTKNFWNVPIDKTASSSGEVILNIFNHGYYGYYNHEFEFVFYASRMPFISYFYAGLGALVPSNLWFVFAIKNLIFLPVFFFASSIALRGAKHKFLFLLLFAGIIFNPQFIYHIVGIDFEEGYLIPLMAFQFGLLIFHNTDSFTFSKNHSVGLFAIINAIIFLTKSSTLYLCLILPFLYYMSDEDKKSLKINIAVLLMVVLSWGLFNFYQTNQFQVTSSINGMNFYKGNNPGTNVIYPRDLDSLKNIRPDFKTKNEWELDNFYLNFAVTYILNNPNDFISSTSLRTFFLFFDINPTPYGMKFSKFNYSIIYIFNLVMRSIFIFSLLFALFSIIFKNKHRATSIIYLLFLFSYSAPFIIGFAYTRHFYPLIVPTLFYLIKTDSVNWLLRNG